MGKRDDEISKRAAELAADEEVVGFIPAVLRRLSLSGLLVLTPGKLIFSGTIYTNPIADAEQKLQIPIGAVSSVDLKLGMFASVICVSTTRSNTYFVVKSRKKAKGFVQELQAALFDHEGRQRSMKIMCNRIDMLSKLSQLEERQIISKEELRLESEKVKSLFVAD